MDKFHKLITIAEGPEKASLGDTVLLAHQKQEVVACEETGVLMLNIDADQLAPGDLAFIKKCGLTISNPETDRPVALGVEYKTFGRKLADWFDSEDDDDDTPFFSIPSSSSSSSSSGFGFGGMSSFGGFGGGSFSGGGASRSF